VQQALPSQVKPSWNGDFSTGNWSQYDGTPNFGADGLASDFQLASSPSPFGFARAFEATVSAGGQSVMASEAGDRTLLTLWPSKNPGVPGKTQAYEGADSWYRDEVYFPQGFQATRDTDWNWLYELHQYPEPMGSANLALTVVNDDSDGGGPANAQRLSTRILGGASPANPIDGYNSSNFANNPDVHQHWFVGPSLQTGHWYHFVWHVHWDWQGAGLVEEWIDGVKVGSYSGPTLFYYANNGTGNPGPGQAYLQDGYYRPTDSDAGYAQPQVQVYHAATMIGPSAASIGENVAGG
jgi:hypothetical protein